MMDVVVSMKDCVIALGDRAEGQSFGTQAEQIR